MFFKRCGWLVAILMLAAGCVERPAENSLRAECDLAVRAAVRWLEAYLADPRMTQPLGVDAVGVFSGYAASAADEESREFARSAARRQARRVEQIYLSRERFTPADLLDLLYLIVEMRELDLDVSALRKLAKREIESLPTPNFIYSELSLSPDSLEQLPEHRFTGLVLAVYAVERAAAYGERFGIEFGLEEFMPVMRSRPLLEGQRDHVYRAAHIAYLFNEYGRLRRTEQDAPEVYDYLRKVFPEFLAARDIELVGEIVDVWRNLGYDETNSEEVRDGTRFLLDAQNADGSWGRPADARHPYAAVHHTWCAIMALGERRFQQDTPYERRLREVLKP